MCKHVKCRKVKNVNILVWKRLSQHDGQHAKTKPKSELSNYRMLYAN